MALSCYHAGLEPGPMMPCSPRSMSYNPSPAAPLQTASQEPQHQIDGPPTPLRFPSFWSLWSGPPRTVLRFPDNLTASSLQPSPALPQLRRKLHTPPPAPSLPHSSTRSPSTTPAHPGPPPGPSGHSAPFGTLQPSRSAGPAPGLPVRSSASTAVRAPSGRRDRRPARPALPTAPRRRRPAPARSPARRQRQWRPRGGRGRRWRWRRVVAERRSALGVYAGLLVRVELLPLLRFLLILVLRWCGVSHHLAPAERGGAETVYLQVGMGQGFQAQGYARAIAVHHQGVMYSLFVYTCQRCLLPIYLSIYSLLPAMTAQERGR